VLRPEGDTEEDGTDEDPTGMREEVAVLVIVLEFNPEDVAVADVDIDEAVLEVAEPVIELEALAALSNACGAGAAQVSDVGFAQSVPPSYVQPQHAHKPVSGLYMTSGTGLSAQCSVHSPLEYDSSVHDAVM